MNRTILKSVASLLLLLCGCLTCGCSSESASAPSKDDLAAYLQANPDIANAGDPEIELE